jgi:hypothetical protein
MGVGRVWRLAATLLTSMVWFGCFFFLLSISCFVFLPECIEVASMEDSKENLHYLIKTYSSVAAVGPEEGME